MMALGQNWNTNKLRLLINSSELRSNAVLVRIYQQLPTGNAGHINELHENMELSVHVTDYVNCK
jgi:hypothetical protein